MWWSVCRLRARSLGPGSGGGNDGARLDLQGWTCLLLYAGHACRWTDRCEDTQVCGYTGARLPVYTDIQVNGHANRQYVPSPEFISPAAIRKLNPTPHWPNLPSVLQPPTWKWATHTSAQSSVCIYYPIQHPSSPCSCHPDTQWAQFSKSSPINTQCMVAPTSVCQQLYFH